MKSDRLPRSPADEYDLRGLNAFHGAFNLPELLSADRLHERIERAGYKVPLSNSLRHPYDTRELPASRVDVDLKI